MPRLTRKYQVAAKIESIEGTPETLAAADAKILAYNPVCNPTPEFYDRTPSLASGTKRGKLIGKRPMNLTFDIEMRGSGTATTEPAWAKLLKACGLKWSTLKTIAIGAISSGPFQHGETISGGTSSATGRVIKNTVNGTTTLYYVALSGTFQSSEVITGLTSGASASSTGAPADAGKVIEPHLLYGTGGIDSLTMAGYEDGGRKLLRGARGNAQFSLKAGNPGTISLDFKGVEEAIASVAMLSGVSHETPKPPIFCSASFTIDSFAAKIRELNIDPGNTLAARDDGNDAKSILSYLISDRNPTGSMVVEMVAAATFDFYAKMAANSEMEMNCILGTTTGNKFNFYAPRLQFGQIQDQDLEGIKGLSIPFTLNGSDALSDDDYAILVL